MSKDYSKYENSQVTLGSLDRDGKLLSASLISSIVNGCYVASAMSDIPLASACVPGDIAVISGSIGEDNSLCTINVYYCNGDSWQSLAGKHKCEDVYFDNDLSIGLTQISVDGFIEDGVIKSKGKSLCYVLSGIANIVDSTSQTKLDAMIDIEWAQLIALKNDKQLVPGQQYRIIDYVTTTNGNMASRSASHQFDIIAIADSTNTLNENVRAIAHEGDEYFSNSNLAAWRIQYCIENDINTFSWVDETNGKGVIYHLIDEFGNDCQYDFKNIQFQRNPNDPKYYFTFNGNELDVDASLNGNAQRNVIDFYIDNRNGKKTLNDIVFIGSNAYSNIFGRNCYSTTFLSSCYSNTFGEQCYNNSFGINCYSNSFRRHCYNNSFKSNCHNNTFGHTCYANAFGNECYYNVFGNMCYYNIFGDSCYANVFSDQCYSNQFGLQCVANRFGGNCRSNIFNRYCFNNELKSSCSLIILGARNEDNIFGNYCKSIKFIDNEEEYKSYVRSVVVKDRNQNIQLKLAGAAGPTGEDPDAYIKYYQNIVIDYGVNTTTETQTTVETKTIVDSNVDQQFVTTYQAANSRTISV